MFSQRDAETCPVKPSGHQASYEKRKASKKKRKDLAVLAKTSRLNRFF